ncbi:MerR family transcriptional regulator [Nocardia sp. 004]|uniref:MerR family transcriptional regulator n=1 Tax=Nocardia sp. 004 TaxID=3385978 RepID=UPI0039A097F7
MRIGELATKTGVSVRALRYYEEHDLLAATRSPSGQRHYPDSAIGRVELIQRLYAAGLSSKTILTILPCVSNGHATPELVQRLVSERDRIDQTISDLVRTRDQLDTVIEDATAVLASGGGCGQA